MPGPAVSPVCLPLYSGFAAKGSIKTDWAWTSESQREAFLRGYVVTIVFVVE